MVMVDAVTDRLLEAARNEDVGAVRATLDQGAYPNRPTPLVDGWDGEGHDEDIDEAMLSPLTWAAKKGNAGVAALLLDRGADPSQARTNGGVTALMLAVQDGHVEVAWLLLERAADPNQARTDDGVTAIMLAAQNDHVELARLLQPEFKDGFP